MKSFSRMRRQPAFRSMAGISMIEVLVAVLILVFGVLGVAALQMTALRNSQSAMQHSQGVALTYAMIDRMRADALQGRIGSYNLGNLGSDLGGTGTTVWTCALPDAGTLPQNERREWMQQVQAELGPTACGIIDCDDANCAVGVRWDDSRGTAGDANQRLITRTRL